MDALLTVGVACYNIENRGLGGARNSVIREAKGESIPHCTICLWT